MWVILPSVEFLCLKQHVLNSLYAMPKNNNKGIVKNAHIIEALEKL